MALIKMFVTIRSRPEVSKSVFHDHWRHPHGTWGRGIANIVSYVQNHRIDTPHLGAGQGEMDGVVEVGCENAADLAGLSQDPAYLDFLKPDEPNFVENTGLGLMEEAVLQSGPPRADGHAGRGWPWRESEQAVSIKLIQVARDEIPWRRDDDLALGQALGAVRHVVAIGHPALTGQAPDSITGLRQLWWPTVTDFERGIGRDGAAWQALIGRAGYTGLFQAERFI